MARSACESFLGPGSVRPREELAARLAGELRLAFLYVKQFREDDVSQLLICGDMPEIRSLTAPLIERVNMEVETLDSLDGIDTEHLPEPADQFLDQVSSLRVASSVAAAPPPINLLPDARERHLGSTGRIAAVVGVAAALALAAFLYEASTTHVDVAPPKAAAVRPEVHPSPRVSPTVQPPVPKPTFDNRPATFRNQLPPGNIRQSTVADRRAPRAGRRLTSAEPQKGGRASSAVAAVGVSGPDPVVRTILYSSQHRAALVDGKIVRPGDYVGRSLVREIEPNAVILITDAGVVKRLPLEQPAISATKHDP